jgi:hypothetical protein
MDILAHMLWANYGARTLNKKLEKKQKPRIHLGWVTFWGVFPDLFAFAIPIIISIPTLLMNGFSMGRPEASGLPATLYQYSHSIVIWAVVFIVAWIIAKRPRLELLGWTLHILIDIPSHGATFYPTPFLFPVSDYRFIDGISWSNPWYMVINYSLLLVVSLYFFRKKKEKVVEKSI